MFHCVYRPHCAYQSISGHLSHFHLLTIVRAFRACLEVLFREHNYLCTLGEERSSSIREDCLLWPRLKQVARREEGREKSENKGKFSTGWCLGLACLCRSLCTVWGFWWWVEARSPCPQELCERCGERWVHGSPARGSKGHLTLARGETLLPGF